MANHKNEVHTLPDGREGYPGTAGFGVHLGMSDAQVKRVIREYDFPKKVPCEGVTGGVWIIEEVKEWQRTRVGFTLWSDGRSNGTKEEYHAEVEAAKLFKLKQDARHRKLQADALEGRFVERVFVDRVLHSYVQLVRSKIEDWCETLPPQMEGMSSVERRAVIREKFDQLCVDMERVAKITPEEGSPLKNDRNVRAGKAQGGQRGVKKKIGME